MASLVHGNNNLIRIQMVAKMCQHRAVGPLVLLTWTDRDPVQPCPDMAAMAVPVHTGSLALRLRLYMSWLSLKFTVKTLAD